MLIWWSLMCRVARRLLPFQYLRDNPGIEVPLNVSQARKSSIRRHLTLQFGRVQKDASTMRNNIGHCRIVLPLAKKPGKFRYVIHLHLLKFPCRQQVAGIVPVILTAFRQYRLSYSLQSECLLIPGTTGD